MKKRSKQLELVEHVRLRSHDDTKLVVPDEPEFAAPAPVEEPITSSQPQLEHVPSPPVASTSGDAEPGTIGAYRVLGVIGSGGMGKVYKVEHVATGKVMACKLLHKELAANPVNVKRFQQEVEATSKLNHPNLVTVYDSGVTDGGVPYLIMDYIEGRSLEDLLASEGYLSVERMIDIFVQVSEALAHVHGHQLLHRDLKPSNIMIVESGSSDFVKLVDLGIARVLQQATATGTLITQEGDLLGSPQYMSPEQCLGKTIDARSDIYSLGITMYQALCGMLPFAGNNPIELAMKHLKDTPRQPAKLRPDFKIPPWLERLVMAMLEKDPAARVQSVDDVLNCLSRRCAWTAKRKFSLRDALRTPKGMRMVAAACGALVLLLCASSFFQHGGAGTDAKSAALW
jgi:serine/threonine-protein kinase